LLAAGCLLGIASPAHAADCPWMNTAKSPEQRATELLKAMSIDDKITLVHQAQPVWAHYGVAGFVPGNPSLCIPDLSLNDAGQGVGDQKQLTVAFPSGIAQASSWDTALQKRFGQVLGSEAYRKGVNVQLAPDVNIARFPMNGRNSEAFGEDPYFAGQVGAAEIAGIQLNPVIATVKHYAANNHEVNRMTVSSDVDDRTLHEIYTPAFEAAVRQGHAGSVMCSYNRVNGVYACENQTLLNKILKGQFGFTGWVMSDWGGTHSTVAAANSGLDQEMDVAPGRYFGDALKTAVQSGQVPGSRLNDMVVRILRPMFQFGLFDHPLPPEPGASATNVETPEDIALARTISEEGTVLLKNDGPTLPLDQTGKRIAVIGPGAGLNGTQQSYNTGGSAHIPEFGNKADVVTPLQGMQQRASANGDTVLYADGSSTADAVAAATASDVAVVFANDGEAEGTDRKSLSLPGNQDALIQSVAQANPHTVVVLHTGGPMVMPWLSQVKGVVQAWYPGQEDGNAIAAVLFGDVDPSGKLPETFPKSEADLPTTTTQQYPGVNDANGVPHAKYSEGLKVGYRWYDAQHIEPLFPFGFGLSYTTFDLRRLSITAASGGVTGATVGFDVVNTGSRSGAEVPQLYVGAPAATGEPPKQLKGFTKVRLDAGESRHITLPLDSRSFAYWDSGVQDWRVAAGCYDVMLGRSSRDIVQHGLPRRRRAHSAPRGAADLPGHAQVHLQVAPRARGADRQGRGVRERQAQDAPPGTQPCQGHAEPPAPGQVRGEDRGDPEHRLDSDQHADVPRLQEEPPQDQAHAPPLRSPFLRGFCASSA
jgi:beta-glucosidase